MKNGILAMPNEFGCNILFLRDNIKGFAYFYFGDFAMLVLVKIQ